MIQRTDAQRDGANRASVSLIDADFGVLLTLLDHADEKLSQVRHKKAGLGVEGCRDATDQFVMIGIILFEHVNGAQSVEYINSAPSCVIEKVVGDPHDVFLHNTLL